LQDCTATRSSINAMQIAVERMEKEFRRSAINFVTAVRKRALKGVPVKMRKRHWAFTDDESKIAPNSTREEIRWVFERLGRVDEYEKLERLNYEMFSFDDPLAPDGDHGEQHLIKSEIEMAPPLSVKRKGAKT